MSSLETISEAGGGFPVGRRVGRTLLLLLFLCAPAAFANTSLFTDSRVCTLPLPYCNELSYYGVLVGNTSDTLTLNGNFGSGWTIDGGVAIGGTGTNGSNFNRGLLTNTVNGPIDFANAVNYNAWNCNATTATNYCGAGTLNGSTPTNANASRVNAAENQLDSILAKLATYNSGSPGTLGASGSFNVGSGSSVKVYRNTSNYTSTGALTFGCGTSTCDPDKLVIVILAGAGSQSFNYNVNLTGGLTSDQLIFYIPNGNLQIQPTAGATNVYGNFFLAKSDGDHNIGSGIFTNGDPVNLRGRVYADNGTLTFNYTGGTQQDLGHIGPVPEPGTWALITGGLGLIVWKAAAGRRSATSSGIKTR